MSSNFRLRSKKILRAIKEQRVDCFLLSSEPNVSYAAGFNAPDSYLVVSGKGASLITDFRYSADFLKKAEPPLKIVEVQGSIFKTISDLLLKEAPKKVGFESRHMPFAECQVLHDLSKKRVTWVPLKETLEPLRQIKEKEELQNIKKALNITSKAYDLVKAKLKPGITELHIAAELERFIRLEGATSNAFDTIVASGPNSSYPHAKITNRPIKNGEPVVIDMGVTFNGYKCDLTRTFIMGKINPIVRRAFNIVEEAQKQAIKAIKPGIAIKDIDAAARDFISKNGFGKNFGHALGHGVGLEVHEEPSINKNNGLSVKKGMVFTIEPGIYITGSFGIRIEDMVLVTGNGVEVLSGNIKH